MHKLLLCCNKWNQLFYSCVRKGKKHQGFSNNEAQTCFLWKVPLKPCANCQRIKAARSDVNLFYLAFVNYHKCHNHQKTTDDLAHANVWHFYLYTLCSAALFPPLFITHYTTPASDNYSSLTHLFCLILDFLNAEQTCKFEYFYFQAALDCNTSEGKEKIWRFSLRCSELQRICTCRPYAINPVKSGYLHICVCYLSHDSEIKNLIWEVRLVLCFLNYAKEFSAKTLEYYMHSNTIFVRVEWLIFNASSHIHNMVQSKYLHKYTIPPHKTPRADKDCH